MGCLGLGDDTPYAGTLSLEGEDRERVRHLRLVLPSNQHTLAAASPSL